MSPKNPTKLELNAIVERIKEILYLRSDAQVARVIEIPPKNLAERKTRNAIPFEKLVYFSLQQQVSMDWLLTGIGSPHAIDEVSEELPEPQIQEESPSSDPASRPSASKFIFLPKDDVEASAGKIQITRSEQIVDHLAFNRTWIENGLGIDPNNLLLITALGDAMEPTIQAGALLLLDCSVTEVKEDGIYGVVLNHTLLIKRVQRLFDDSLVVMSDNPVYAEQKLSQEKAAQLKVLGRLVWMGNTI